MSRPTTVLVVAGEASGDLHAARLVDAFREHDPSIRVLAIGGEKLRAAGATIVRPLDELNVVGLTEVVAHLPRILGVLGEVKRLLRSGEVDLCVPVDFPDFNFRVARAAHAAGVPVFYYIAPQVWAWRTGRVKEMARWCDLLGVLFPFEVPFFEKAGIPTVHAGHPLVDELHPTRAIDAVRRAVGARPDRPLVGLLPGSRRSEVERHLGLMVRAVDEIREREGLDVDVAIGRASTIPADVLAGAAPGVAVCDPPSVDLVAAADLVFCASGTATVEVALTRTPMVVVYRLSAVSWFLARRMVKLREVAMANLVAGDAVVPELLQDEATPSNLAREGASILRSEARQTRMRRGYDVVRERLAGGVGLPALAARALALVTSATAPPVGKG